MYVLLESFLFVASYNSIHFIVFSKSLLKMYAEDISEHKLYFLRKLQRFKHILDNLYAISLLFFAKSQNLIRTLYDR